MELQRITISENYQLSIRTDNMMHESDLTVGLHHKCGKETSLSEDVALALFESYEKLKEHCMPIMWRGTLIYTFRKTDDKWFSIGLRKRRAKGNVKGKGKYRGYMKRWRFEIFNEEKEKLRTLPMTRADLLMMYGRRELLERLLDHWERQKTIIVRQVRAAVMPGANISLKRSCKRILLKCTKPGKFLNKKALGLLPKQLQNYLKKWTSNIYVLAPDDQAVIIDWDDEGDF